MMARQRREGNGQESCSLLPPPSLPPSLHFFPLCTLLVPPPPSRCPGQQCRPTAGAPAWGLEALLGSTLLPVSEREQVLRLLYPRPRPPFHFGWAEFQGAQAPTEASQTLQHCRHGHGWRWRFWGRCLRRRAPGGYGAENVGEAYPSRLPGGPWGSRHKQRSRDQWLAVSM
jgi:hypothetical protein